MVSSENILGDVVFCAHLQPFHGPDLLVYAARGSDVHSVMVNGRLVVKDQKQTGALPGKVLRR